MNKKISILLFAFACCLSAWSQTDIDTAVDAIVSRNPGLKATKANLDVLALERKAENNLPNPEVEGSYQWGRHGAGDKWGIEISQSFDWPGLYSARNHASNVNIEMLQAEYDAALLDATYNTRILLIDLIGAKRTLVLANETASRMSQLESHYREAYKAGEATILDLNKIVIENIAAQRELTTAKNTVDALVDDLIARGDGDESLRQMIMNVDQYPASELASEQTYVDAMLAHNPSLQSLTLRVKLADADLSVSKRSWFPSLRIGYSYEYEAGERFNGVIAGISIPVFANRHNTRRAQAAKLAAATETEAMRFNLLASIHSNYSSASRIGSELRETRSIALDPRPAELLDKALNGGELTLLQYLQELTFFTDAKRQYEALECEYHRTLCSLNRYLGR